MKLFLLLNLIILSHSAFSQNVITDTSATCVAFWNKEESKIYEILHVKESYSNGNLKSKVEVKYEAHIKLIDSTEDGFMVEWKYKNFKPTDNDKTLNGGMNEIMEGLVIKYFIDNVGAFSALLNWIEVRDYAFNAIDKMVKEKPDGLAFNNLLSKTRKMFETKENIEAILIKEIQLFHTPYGVEFNFAGVEAETNLPNISGGEPFPAKIIVKLDEINSKQNYCTVSLNQDIDKKKAGPIMQKFIQKMAGYESAKDIKDKKRFEEMEISDINKFTYSIDNGWMKKITFNRVVNLLNSKQIEKYQFLEMK